MWFWFQFQLPVSEFKAYSTNWTKFFFLVFCALAGRVASFYSLYYLYKTPLSWSLPKPNEAISVAYQVRITNWIPLAVVYILTPKISFQMHTDRKYYCFTKGPSINYVVKILLFFDLSSSSLDVIHEWRNLIHGWHPRMALSSLRFYSSFGAFWLKLVIYVSKMWWMTNLIPGWKCHP